MAYLNDEAEWEEGVRQLEETDDCEAGVFNETLGQLTHRTSALKAMVGSEAAAREGGDSALAARLNAVEGRGGPVAAHDFESATPSQAALTQYACEEIWGAGGVFTWDSENPAASTYVVDEVTHTAGEIFNATWVRNTYAADDEHPLNHRFVLTNTPDTVPAVFAWENVGYDTVGIATDTMAGLVRSGGDVEVDPVSGMIRITQSAQIVGEGGCAFLTASDKRRLVIKGGTSIKTGTGEYISYFVTAGDMPLDVESLLDEGSALTNGKDYYVFVCRSGNDFEIKVSPEKTAPAGFTADAVKLIGGFHTLCASAGTGMTYVFGGVTLEHPLNGFVSGDILPQSVWCLNHRPFSEPEGMVYIPLLDFWCDIYLQSGNGVNTKSAYQGAVTRSRQYVDVVEDQFCVKKALLNDEEFASAMLGSNEKTAVAGASEGGAVTGGAGGRNDTSNRRMISLYGVEEGCGSLWQWLASTSAAGSTGWVAQAGGKGDYYGNCYVLLAGGDWGKGAYCGSRARAANDARASTGAPLGGRGRSRPAYSL